jgi:hypothetical protein
MRVAGRAGQAALDVVAPAGLLLGHVERSRLMQDMHLERPAARVGRRLQAAARVERDRVLGVVVIVGPRERHDAGAHEAAEVVDVAVGLVGVHATAEPDDRLHAEEVAQAAFDLVAAQLRVAVAVEQALLRHEARALAVDVDRAAFQHERRAVAVGALDLQHLRATGRRGPTGSRGRRRAHPRR